MIAEDQSIIQITHLALMENWRFDCDIASNGKEAVELARANHGQYELCIMDVTMPVMNGIEATHAIRSSVSYFPIMGYSADIEARKLQDVSQTSNSHFTDEIDVQAYL